MGKPRPHKNANFSTCYPHTAHVPAPTVARYLYLRVGFNIHIAKMLFDDRTFTIMFPILF